MAKLAIYLAAESRDIRIINNNFDLETLREKIAIDGSAFATISGNHFSRIDGGGVTLYRNCGEFGAVRHQRPVGNVLIDNDFERATLPFETVLGVDKDGIVPVIWLSSRDGGREYCQYDDEYDFGSGASDLDLVSRTVVWRNRFQNTSAAVAIRKNNLPNQIVGNASVNTFSSRATGCFARHAFPQSFLDSGTSAYRFGVDDKHICVGRQICRDGQLVVLSACD